MAADGPRRPRGYPGVRRRGQRPGRHRARQRPALYRAGRVKGTRELVVRPNYVLVYRVLPDAVEVLRVLHATQQWPPGKRR
jgi:plasmid stabilization system protein ParE